MKKSNRLQTSKAGADFCKTSTGFGTGGATQEDIKLMREAVGPELGVKASGGWIREMLCVIENGATSGASSGITIVKEKSDSDY